MSYDFDILNNAAEGPELNPTFIDPTNYTELEDIVLHLKTRKSITNIRELLPQLSLNGRVLEEDMSKYLAAKACSSGSLKEALKSPRHYYVNVHEPKIKKDKKCFDLGTFCHSAFLEPEKFELLAVEPQASMSTKEGVAILTGFWEKVARKEQKKTGKQIITYCRRRVKTKRLDMSKMDGMKFYLSELKRLCGKISVDWQSKAVVDCIKRNYQHYGGGIIQELMKGAMAETSFYGTDEETGLPVKIRPDAFQIEENIGCNAIISFKTTHADSISKMQYDAANYMYHLSEGMYCDVFEQVTGRKCTAVICIMLQTVSPYLPVVFIYDPEDLQNGKYRYRTALRNVKEAMSKNVWPGFDSHAEEGNFGIIKMKLPEWSLREALPQTLSV